MNGDDVTKAVVGGSVEPVTHRLWWTARDDTHTASDIILWGEMHGTFLWAEIENATWVVVWEALKDGAYIPE